LVLLLGNIEQFEIPSIHLFLPYIFLFWFRRQENVGQEEVCPAPPEAARGF